MTPLATATLVLAANAPDMDILSYFGGEYFAISFRRGITHGWPALIVLPFLATAAILAWDVAVRRRRQPGGAPARPLPLLALSAIGVATHPALDWMNTYGMRWAMPFDTSWTYGDALFIIDPWLWLVLGGSLFIASQPTRTGLVGWGVLATVTSLPLLLFPVAPAARFLWLSALGAIIGSWLAVRRRNPQRSAVRVGLAAALLYICAMVGSDLLARGQVTEAAQAAGLQVRDLMVAPRPADPLGADIEVLTDEGYVPGDFRWTRTPRVRLFPAELVPLIQAPPGMAVDEVRAVMNAARADRNAELYHVWSRYPIARIEPHGEGWAVTFRDARYDDGPAGGALGGPTVTVGPEDIR